MSPGFWVVHELALLVHEALAHAEALALAAPTGVVVGSHFWHGIRDYVAVESEPDPFQRTPRPKIMGLDVWHLPDAPARFFSVGLIIPAGGPMKEGGW